MLNLDKENEKFVGVFKVFCGLLKRAVIAGIPRKHIGSWTFPEVQKWWLSRPHIETITKQGLKFMSLWLPNLSLTTELASLLFLNNCFLLITLKSHRECFRSTKWGGPTQLNNNLWAALVTWEFLKMLWRGSAKKLIKIAVISLGYCRVQGLLKVSHVRRGSVLIKIGLAFLQNYKGQYVFWFRNTAAWLKTAEQ